MHISETVKRDILKGGGLLKGEFFFALSAPENVATEYIDIDPCLTYPRIVEHFGSSFAQLFAGEEFDVIAVPAVGAIPIGYAMANRLDNDKLRTVWADKKNGSFVLERMGFASAVRGARVLVIEDVGSTGDSAKAVCRLVEDAGGIVVAVGFIWNRGNVTAEKMGVPLVRSLVNQQMHFCKATEHSQWGKWPLVDDIGHPEHFPDYPGPRIKLLK